MAKTPVLGLVKTRLGRAIGAAQATRIYRGIAAAVLGRLTSDPRFETRLAIAPDSGAGTRAFPVWIARQRQGRGDLGAKLHRAAASAPPGPVVIIGTDIPCVRPVHIHRAFAALGRADVVVGPAEDGGFWLIGFHRRRAMPDCYRGVRWSHAETLRDVLANLSGRSVAVVDILSDVDAADDVRRFAREIGRRVI